MRTPPQGTAEIEISIAGYPIRNLAAVVVARHSGEITVTTIPDQLGRAPLEVDAVRRMSDLLVERAAADDPFPEVDKDGEWQVRIDGNVVDDVAAVLVRRHDGLVAAAAVPNPDGWAPSPQHVQLLLHTLETELTAKPDGDDPPRLVFGAGSG